MNKLSLELSKTDQNNPVRIENVKMNIATQVIEEGSDPVGSGRISSRSVEFRYNPDRIPIERNPTKIGSGPIGFL
jgi:hypothetical protein